MRRRHCPKPDEVCSGYASLTLGCLEPAPSIGADCLSKHAVPSDYLMWTCSQSPQGHWRQRLALLRNVETL